MRKFISIVLFLTTLFFQSTASADLEKGVAAMLSGDDAKAVKELEIEAKKGNVKVQSFLAGIYANEQSPVKNYLKAALWYAKAADQGDLGSLSDLGVMYLNGKGVKQNKQRGLKMLNDAAEGGNAGAQYNLGVIYYEGRLTELDYIKAAYWYKKAANQDDPPAQYNLALMYLKGKGIEKNMVEGYKWLDIASSRNFKEATSVKDMLTSKMLFDDVIEAKKQADNWRKSHKKF